MREKTRKEKDKGEEREKERNKEPLMSYIMPKFD